MPEKKTANPANGAGRSSASRAWVAPEIEDLPGLTRLTLQTGIPDTTPEGGGMTI